MTEFKSSAEMFAAGYCVQQYSANPNSGDLWRFNNEFYETRKGAVRAIINARHGSKEMLPVYIASRSDVLAARVSHG